jgi:tripeptide aminopeptidase
MSDVLDRFLRYVQIDTQSDDESDTVPSTPGQWDLLHLLRDELTELGASEIDLSEFGVLTATIPASPGHENAPVVALFSHVDTALEMPGKHVKPRVHRNYDGAPILFPDNPELALRKEDYPLLANKIGKTIVTASGATLLGGDDKAGVAVVMTAADYLLSHPDVVHGKIRLCFNPDEEIGRGTKNLDLDFLGADFAYTLDGRERGELVFETFSADRADIRIEGYAIYPGKAKGKLIHATRAAAKIIEMLPFEGMAPETTEGRVGYIHPISLHGEIAHAHVHLILRDFELDGLENQRQILRDICAAVKAQMPGLKVELQFTEQYRNMRYWLENDMRPVKLVMSVYEELGIEPIINAMRGGTDGAMLTERGLPTPNIFRGSDNAHGPLEYACVEDMELSVKMVVRLAERWGTETK